MTLRRSYLRPAVFFCICILSGCAGAPAPVVQRVEVPVPVPCLVSGDVPVGPIYQFDKLPVTASDGEKVIALAHDWPLGRKYEGELAALVAGCR